MKRTKIEKLISVIAWLGLVGGILFSALVCKSTLYSSVSMCVPKAMVELFGGVFLSVGCWAILMELLALADRIKKLENKKEGDYQS